MKLAITGGTGLVGSFLVNEARAAGDRITLLSREQVPGFDHVRYQLGDTPDLSGFDALIHCAFSHVPGRYRGGEGTDPAGFRRTNLEGTIALFKAAKATGVRRVLFLSSRAVYDGLPPGTNLTEDLSLKPTSLYGQIKLEAEHALAHLIGPHFAGASLRATGVYGAGPDHKWTSLFQQFLQGTTPPPRCGTEVHGRDLAAAIRLLLTQHAGLTGPFNVSDLCLDRRDLLCTVAEICGCQADLPARDTRPLSQMDCSRLLELGWQPGGADLLKSELAKMFVCSQFPAVNQS